MSAHLIVMPPPKPRDTTGVDNLRCELEQVKELLSVAALTVRALEGACQRAQSALTEADGVGRGRRSS